MNVLFTAVLVFIFGAVGYLAGRRDDKRYIPLVVVAFLLAADPWRCASESLQAAISNSSPLAKLATVTVFGTHIGSLDIAFAAMLVTLIAAIGSRLAIVTAFAGTVVAIAGGIAIVHHAGGFLPGTYFLVLGITPAIVISRRQIWAMPRSDQMLIAISTPLCLAIGLIAII